jgi:hypothetical protein
MAYQQTSLNPFPSGYLEISVEDFEVQRHKTGSIKPMQDRKEVAEVSRTVSFGDIQVMEFPMELGDNPSVTRGCPLTIGWEMLRRTVYDVESYERLRPPERRRSSKQLRIPTEKRTQILLNQGHSLQEIASTAKTALKIKDSRLLTSQNRNQNFDRLYGALVMAGRRVAAKTASI